MTHKRRTVTIFQYHRPFFPVETNCSKFIFVYQLTFTYRGIFRKIVYETHTENRTTQPLMGVSSEIERASHVIILDHVKCNS